jgi:hypothetical protein
MYTDLEAALEYGLLAGLSTAAFFLYIRFNILTKLILENQGALALHYSRLILLFKY